MSASRPAPAYALDHLAPSMPLRVEQLPYVIECVCLPTLLYELEGMQQGAALPTRPSL